LCLCDKELCDPGEGWIKGGKLASAMRTWRVSGLAEAMVRKRKEALAREHPVRAFTRVSSNEMFDFCGCAGFGVSLLFGCVPAGWHPTVEAEVRVGTDCGSGLLFCGAGGVNEVWSEFFL
jgi:hypothetical protein